MKKILFPVDFSHVTGTLLSAATSLARDRDAEMIILHVQEPLEAYMAGEFYCAPIEPDMQAIKNLLHTIRPTDRHVPYRHLLLAGDPATEILRTAEKEEVEMIVMSTHGRSGLSRVLMGSVAEAVLRRAKVPVMILKTKHAVATLDPHASPA